MRGMRLVRSPPYSPTYDINPGPVCRAGPGLADSDQTVTGSGDRYREHATVVVGFSVV